jgi:oligosaccharyltransferase complex subunit beta
MMQFFEDLQVRGNQLTHLDIDRDPLSLESYGEYVYDSIVLFAPTMDMSSAVAASLFQFMEAGGNLLVAVDESINESMSVFAEMCGAYL